MAPCGMRWSHEEPNKAEYPIARLAARGKGVSRVTPRTFTAAADDDPLAMRNGWASKAFWRGVE